MLLIAALAMLACSIANADNQPAPSNQTAIGLSVIDQGISLWLIRPKTMWDLELDRLERTWDDLILNTQGK